MKVAMTEELGLNDGLLHADEVWLNKSKYKKLHRFLAASAYYLFISTFCIRNMLVLVFKIVGLILVQFLRVL